jgi:lipoyl(octanoyl) transferase
MQTVELYDLGRFSYQPAWDLQTAIHQQLIKQKRNHQSQDPDKSQQRDNEVLLFVEHPHVYTLGKSGNSAHLLKRLAELKDLNAEYIEIDRGGDITYHGPGQIVCYPILDLDRHFTDIHKYMRCLEEVVIRTCSEYDIEAGRIEGLTGVWIDKAKICAMGVRCSRWVTMHGFALNVNTDLSYFDNIIPCGIRDKEVTSLQRILEHQIDEDNVKNHLVKHFETIFKVNITKNSSLYELNNKFLYSKKGIGRAALQ